MTIPIDWRELQTFVDRLAQPGAGPGSVTAPEWGHVEETLATLIAQSDGPGLIHLRTMFAPLFAGDTVTALPFIQRLEAAAIHAAEQTNANSDLANFLGAQGHNLHRQGFHLAAVAAFERTAQLYREMGDAYNALKNLYMTALCLRAIGKRTAARAILTVVLQEVAVDDPWRGDPLQVLAWLTQDEGNLVESEHLLRAALDLQRQDVGRAATDLVIAGTLADLGEVVSLQGRQAEATAILQQSLALLAQHAGQFDRQEANTALKLAELYARQRRYAEALQLLNQADDLARIYGHYYDLLWRIELARALIFIWQGRFALGFRKIRSAFRYRHRLHLSNLLVVRQVLTRWWSRVDLLRGGLKIRQ